MKKLLLSVLAIALTLTAVPQFVFAGGIENKQNFSARYMATGSRNAALDGADIAAYNPAGIMMKEDNGFLFQADVQYIPKDYEHDVDNTAFNNDATADGIISDSTGTALTDAEIDSGFSGDQDEASILPTFFTTYKNDKWGAFGSFTINGGGGEVDYKDGNSVTNQVARSIHLGIYNDALPQGADFGIAGGPNAGSLTSNESVFADSYYYTFTAGATYAFTDQISMALGARYVMAEKSIEAYADVDDVLTGGTDTVRADYEQDADGMGFVVGFDYKATDTLNFAIRYESEVELEFDTDIDKGNTALGNAILQALEKADANGKGVDEDRNLPAVLGLGISKKLTDRFTVDTSFTYYFEEQADWDGHEDNVSNSWDFGLAGTFSVTDDFRISAGYLHTDVGIDANDYDFANKLSPPLDAHTLAIGCGYDLNEKMTLEFGAMSINYVSDTAESTIDETGTPTAEIEYDKQNYNVAVSFMYKL